MDDPASQRQSQVHSIEHAAVRDDPRKWSKGRKRFTLALVSSASLLLTLAVSIYNPAIDDIIQDLNTSFESISWTISIHALVQGCFPLMWGAFSELYGRKVVYLLSIALFILGSGIAGATNSIGMLIEMRVIQGIGGSAVLTIGAATLADIYDPEERGSAMGLYYAAPLIGPSLGPLIGGALTSFFSWRATFYFLAIFGGVSFIGFLFFKDTFRPQRSSVYQAALRDVLESSKNLAAVPSYEDRRHLLASTTEEAGSENQPLLKQDVKLKLSDMHLIRPIVQVSKRLNNICILIASGLIYGGITYCISYTSVRTFGGPPYNYQPLFLGLVLLSFGVGNMFGSVLGGRWSDYIRKIYKDKNGGVSKCEDRLNSAKIMMPILPLSLLGYGWMAEKKFPILPICVAMFLTGFSSLWIYSSILAYIVDANAGRSSSAVAVNSFFRGLMAFIAAEVAIPLQTALGDGSLYTLISGIMIIESGLLLLLITKGGEWRESAEREEKRL
ncbi:major facilitator superfamily domain-containing protein [Gymnopilus junonius]|uniref:Major facilitator superfamily domain-containing protein n=1 Tax=Gymnopilus junonius TaxID=109634 RepID=A0A9P5TLQ4_GYMJU|nr:major facilitator superfamily domain-containing protein [Gymnopilus junonius]